MFLYHNRRNKERKKFEQGIEYTNIIEGYPIIMKSFVEMDREVLRVLLPDERGFFLRGQSVMNVIRLNWMILRRVDKKSLKLFKLFFMTIYVLKYAQSHANLIYLP